MVKSGSERKRTREVPTQTKFLSSSRSEEHANVRNSVTILSTKTAAEDKFNSLLILKVQICLIWKQWKILSL
jgi:hypothetical protein